MSTIGERTWFSSSGMGRYVFRRNNSVISRPLGVLTEITRLTPPRLVLMRTSLDTLSTENTDSRCDTGSLFTVTCKLDSRCWGPLPHTVLLSSERTDRFCTSITSEECRVSLEPRNVVLKGVCGDNSTTGTSSNTISIHWVLQVETGR